jgi:predicted component of type VI protein secretion system
MQLETLPRARAIVRAWQTNDVLPQGVTVDYPKAVNQYEECAESIPRLGIEDLRGNFEEFL